MGGILDLDILDEEITEDAEFAAGSYATADVGNHVGDPKVKAPTNEKPNAKPYDQRELSIPGGNGETPASKPYDQSSISVPKGTVLTDTQWKSMMNKLNKSFNEALEVMAMMTESTVIHKTTNEIQAEYTESVIDQAILESFENGPLFEAVERSDKDEVKKIVREIRGPIAKECKEMGVKFKTAKLLARLLVDSEKENNQAIDVIWNTRLWQIIGVIYVEDGNVSEVANKLTEKHKDVLKSYKILPVKVTENIIDKFNTKFGWKNNKNTYFILVDKKITEELKKSINDLGGKSEPKTESFEDDLDAEYDAYVAEATKYQNYKKSYEAPNEGEKGLAVSGGERNMKAGTLDRKEFNDLRKNMKKDLDDYYDKYKESYKQMVKEHGKDYVNQAFGKLKPKHQWIGETLAEYHKRDGKRYS